MSLRMVGGKLVSDDDEPITEATEDIEKDKPTGSLTDDGYPICDGCGKANYEWQPGNRGRKPRYHKDCRPVSPQRGVRQGTRNEAALRDALEQRYMSLARILSLVHPAYGAGVREKMEQAVNADLAYARVNPRFRKALERGLDKTALGEVVAVHTSMVVPIVVGESAKRGRAKAAQGQAKGKGEPPKPQTPSQPRQTPPPPPPANVHPIRPDDDDSMMPGEYEPTGPSGEARQPETVNAAAMPGMPGG